MELRDFKNLCDVEISKLNNVPIEVELVYARVYAKMVESMYRPVVAPVQVKEKKPKKEKKVRIPKPLIAMGEGICIACNEVFTKYKETQRYHNVKDSQYCYGYMHAKYVGEKNYPDKPYQSYEQYVEKQLLKK
jgi:hypothetical protein